MTPLPIRLRLTLIYFSAIFSTGVVLCAATWLLLQRSFQHAGMMVTDAVQGQPHGVQAAMSHVSPTALAHTFAGDLLLLALLLGLLSALLACWISARAFAPIARLALQAREISLQNVNLRLPVSAANDELTHLATTFNQMLARMDRSTRSVRDFTANAARELRAPVALIRSEVETALSSAKSIEEYRESFANLHQGTIHVSGLLDNLLMLARADAGTEVFNFEVIDAGRLMRRVGESWKASMCQAMLEFQVETRCAPALIRVDVVMMQRMLNILLENASRFTPPGGSITLRATADTERVLMEVCDTGIGISGEHLPRLFQRFYRVDSVRSRQLGGSGLGLAVAKWIADEHQATLIVESEIGKGTRFRIALEQQHSLETRMPRALAMANSL
jgi:signal transduction histidine kinase